MTDSPNTQPPATGARPVGRPRRSQQDLLDAAAAVFVEYGVDAPVREIATRAGVGMGTIYRHFPTRAALVVAVYRHQVEACAEAAPSLLTESATAEAALRAWMGLFVEFLVTKHGLADALRGDNAGSDELHAYFVDRLVPVCGMLLDAARAEKGLPGHGHAPNGYNLLKGVGNLCIGADGDSSYDADGLVQLLVSGALAGTAVS